MTTFTKTFTVTDETGAVRTFTHTYQKMDDKMFEHYKQNPLGMDKVVREHFKIPDDKNYSVTMWSINGDETVGCVSLQNKEKKKE